MGRPWLQGEHGEQPLRKDGTTHESTGASLYLDVMPAAEGQITIGLYTDSACNQVYNGKYKIEDVLYTMGYGSGSGGLDNVSYDDDDAGNNNQYNGNRRLDDGNYATLLESHNAWNKGFDHFKVCQPCITYTPPRKWSEYGGAEGGDGNDENGMGKFQCQGVSQVFYVHSAFCRSNPIACFSHIVSLPFLINAVHEVRYAHPDDLCHLQGPRTRRLARIHCAD
jgi:hypothetical protein